MAEMKNSLKDIDMKIVMKRLEARKRDGNQDGSLSKKQLASAYRGYHGLEMQYHALLRMSNDKLVIVKNNNDKLANIHDDKLKQLRSQEKLKEDIIDRDLKNMRQDFTAQLAYQYVYKNYSLRQNDAGQKQRKPRPLSDHPDMYDNERKQSASGSAPRPLGSLRQIETYKDELKLKFPPIKEKKAVKSTQVSPRPNAMGERTYEDLKQRAANEAKKAADFGNAFPNIEDALGVEIRYRHRQTDDDKGSMLSAPAGMLKDIDQENVHIEYFSMGQNLMLMRKLAQEGYDRTRHLPAPPPSRSEARKESWRRILPPTPDRPPSVFPNNTKNASDMKKMIRKEASNVMETWANTNKRKEAVERIKEAEKLKKQDSSFPTFEAARPTSAILKDFIDYKNAQEEEKMMREEKKSDQPLFVRQLSPQPRVTSPHLQRRSEYSAKYYSPSREGSVVSKEVPIRRTESEKIPSVSRTASLNNVGDGPVEMHENALLTAAERIEKEKQIRELEKDIEEYNKAIEQKSHTSRRKLPPTPQGSEARLSRKRTRERRRQPTKMFDTSILAINQVSKANSHSQFLETSTALSTSVAQKMDSGLLKPVSEQGNVDEHKSSLSDIERRLLEKIHSSNTSLGHYDHKLDSAKLEFITTATGKKLFPQRVQRDYDHYSRTTPQMKRHLEMKAKIRKKIKQRNTQLADERLAKRKTGDKRSVAESERPATQVSFNENVVVFQTI